MTKTSSRLAIVVSITQTTKTMLLMVGCMSSQFQNTQVTV